MNVTPAHAIEMAGMLFAQGKYAQAEKVCLQVIEARPDSADAHNLLGVTLNALGRPVEAIEMLRHALAFAPQAPVVHANLGEVLRQQRKKGDEAVKALDEAVRARPEQRSGAQQSRDYLLRPRNAEGSGRNYQRALAARPDMAEAGNDLGNALRLTGNIEKSIQAYQEALIHRELYPEAYNNLGTLLQQRGQLDEAEHALRKAMTQKLQYIEAYNNLANLYVAQERDTEALRSWAMLSRSLRRTLRRCSSPHGSRCAAMLMSEASERATRQALAQEPDNDEALTILGQVLHGDRPLRRGA